MLKDQLLKEANEIEVSVELDSIFESIELDAEVKDTFHSVFETAVKKHAAELAESRIVEIGEKADKLVESQVEEKTKEIHQKLSETSDKFFKHLAAEWLEENKLAVNRNIKADLFESMFSGLKGLFVEHNVDLPEESVDVVAELEEALEEAETEASKLFDSLTESKEKYTSLKKQVAIKEAVEGLTESQKEKVNSLVEGLEYSEKFDTKLNAIVEMAKASNKEKPQINENINTIDNNDDGLNFIVEKTEPEPASQTNKTISSYVSAAQKY